MTSRPAPLQYREIQQAMQATLTALSRHGLEACLFGSTAAAAYGMDHRAPKDVDFLVLNPTPGQSDKDIKDLVVSSDPNFFLVASRVVGATHRVLWYTLTPPSSKPKHAETCKVDILIPSLLNITRIPNSELHFDPSTSFVSYLPAVPFSTLLMLKLRAWADHSLPTASKVMHDRIPQDEDDIEELLRIGITLGSKGVVRIGPEGDADRWILGALQLERCERAVADYVKKWPRTADGWRDAGFG
ncbi:hypothetical protein BDZ97DRAFT_1652612 [Flammula alnicola]|nr:hypothetical protein BDZ97DRAFT_1652612 [Flammula alnicola]